MKVLMRCWQVGLSSKWEFLLFVLLYSSSYHFWDSSPLCVSGLVDRSVFVSWQPSPSPAPRPPNLTKDFSSDSLLTLSSLGNLAHQCQNLDLGHLVGCGRDR